MEIWAREVIRLELSPINVLLRIQRRKHHGLVMDIGCVLVDGGSGLRAQIAVARVEVERAHMMGAVRARKLHAALYASDTVKAFHNFNCSPLTGKWKERGVGSEGNGSRRVRCSEMGNESSSGHALD